MKKELNLSLNMIELYKKIENSIILMERNKIKDSTPVELTHQELNTIKRLLIADEVLYVLLRDSIKSQSQYSKSLKEV